MFKNKFILAAVVLVIGFTLFYSLRTSQPYDKLKNTERETYKQTMLQMENTPIDLDLFDHFDYFDPKELYKVTTTFQKSTNAPAFSIQMTDGSSIAMPQSGTATFELNGKKHSVLLFDEDDHYLLPFMDETNGIETYGGGRYINIPKENLDGDQLEIDFNDAHNFYCVYSERFICPVPPKENKILTRIEAGERVHQKEEKSN
jgi:uncharacterized protein